jgi:uncharacterized membrane protein
MVPWWRRLGLWLLLTHPTAADRYWELDVCRGLAILLMVSYHLIFDLAFFGYYDIPVTTGLWRLYGHTSATLFLLLVGTGLTIGYVRRSAHAGRPPAYRGYLARGMKLLGWGGVITLLSWIYLGQPVILFGILHLIGSSIMLAHPFLRLGKTNAIIGLALLLAGGWLNTIPVTQLWLLWLGLRPPRFHQLDWFPLLPWFGLVLIGVAIGTYLYPGGRRRFDLPAWDAQPGIIQLAWLGRHSLLIYLVHQPILLGLLALATSLS